MIVLACGVISAQSKDFWQTKDYREWNEKECKKLLEDSPWAQEYSFTRTLIEPLQRATGERAGENKPQLRYLAQLRSALPIRQALIRMRQIANKYEQMTTEQQREFDQRAATLLTADFTETIAAHLNYGSNVALYDHEMANYWQAQTTEKLKNSTFLIGPKGQKIPPQRFIVGAGAGREFTFYFPRTYEGQPLVGPPDKTIKLEFVHPRIGDQGESRVLLEFKVEKMIFHQTIVY
jgi:hypothetical protein